MYRLLRCNGGLSRRLPAACVFFFLLVTAVLWLRCDESLTSTQRPAFPVTLARSR
jgi:hypothetical protein